MNRDEWFKTLHTRFSEYKQWVVDTGTDEDTEEDGWWEDFTYWIENVAKP